MKIFLLMLLVVITQALPHSKEWNQFKVRHNRQYSSLDEEQKRMDTFLRNQRYIEEHNRKYEQGLVSYSLRMNHLGDLTEEEFLNLHQPRASTPRVLKESQIFKKSKNDLPDKVDWIRYGANVPVKDERNCTASWAFSATGALEGRLYITSGKQRLIPMSEQQLIDCCVYNGGCDGGEATVAYEYLKHTAGIQTEEHYPYRAWRGKCHNATKGAQVIAVNDYVVLPSGDEDALQVAVAEGPVSVSVDARSVDFLFYYKGVFYSEECSSTFHNLGMVIMGYGEEKGKKYWLVKSSLGVNWGDNGYIKMSRNRGNNCAIASDASYPVLKGKTTLPSY